MSYTKDIAKLMNEISLFYVYIIFSSLNNVKKKKLNSETLRG